MSYVACRMSVLCQINCIGGIKWPMCMLSLFGETEEQRKERLRIRREKDRVRRRTKGKKRSPDTDDYEKLRLATLKRLKRGELDLRLEKVVASKQLRLAVETEEERRTRLEAFLKSWQLCLSFKLDVSNITRNS